MINPGTVPIDDAREDLAVSALDVFLTAVQARAAELENAPLKRRIAGLTGEAKRDPAADRDGRFGTSVRPPSEDDTGGRPNSGSPWPLAFAVLLKFYGRYRRFPRGRAELRDEVVEFVAAQVRVPAQAAPDRSARPRNAATPPAGRLSIRRVTDITPVQPAFSRLDRPRAGRAR
ncbi:DUF4158 domain-containing protein [Couchioplanes caeruleus]|uniref:Uncharacterized protein n=1 Tax=Couchioplanes caeruleus TaxID=56438 RepID=A0A3N1FTH9_9ACTN|nr:DUF4158 domain-containing protein [Couchioplanes caeruleus]ROP21230.1 hypothetical protein EDD30_7624 [Couchioplanes caeruleus]